MKIDSEDFKEELLLFMRTSSLPPVVKIVSPQGSIGYVNDTTMGPGLRPYFVWVNED